ncbi:hypothetical protein ACI65C_000021 [Semiaphis heraclei]
MDRMVADGYAVLKARFFVVGSTLSHSTLAYMRGGRGSVNARRCLSTTVNYCNTKPSSRQQKTANKSTTSPLHGDQDYRVVRNS